MDMKFKIITGFAVMGLLTSCSTRKFEPEYIPTKCDYGWVLENDKNLGLVCARTKENQEFVDNFDYSSCFKYMPTLKEKNQCRKYAKYEGKTINFNHKSNKYKGIAKYQQNGKSAKVSSTTLKASKSEEGASNFLSDTWDKLKPKFREESPLWYMTLSNEEINSYFKKTCIESGHSESRASDLNNCIKAARKLSSKNANNRLYQAGQQMQQMDRQRINKHNIAVDKMKQDSQRARTNVYDTSGRLKGYDSYGKWYNKQGQATGEYVKNDKIYDADNKYIGFKRGNQFFNINGDNVARE
jgi:hypothetical protein